MPWPMVHFAIAAAIEPNPSPEFLLGSLAPDAIHTRSNDQSDKAKTHLMIEEGRFATDEELGDFLEASRQRAISHPAFMDYLRGYIAHVYTDRVWTFDIYPPYETHPDGRRVYNQDVAKLEFMLLRNRPDARQWLDRLSEGRAYALAGLGEKEVYPYREAKLNFLNDASQEPDTDLTVISMAEMDAFIQDTADALRALFEQWGCSSLIAQAGKRE